MSKNLFYADTNRRNVHFLGQLSRHLPASHSLGWVLSSQDTSPNRFLKLVLTEQWGMCRTGKTGFVFHNLSYASTTHKHINIIPWSKSNTIVTKLSFSQVQWRWETKENFSFIISTSSHTKIQHRILDKFTVTWINVSINVSINVVMY